MSQVAKVSRGVSSGNERAILRMGLYLAMVAGVLAMLRGSGTAAVVAVVALVGLACSAYREGE